MVLVCHVVLQGYMIKGDVTFKVVTHQESCHPVKLVAIDTLVVNI